MIVLILCAAGCGNLSPRQRQNINNQGKIGEIEDMTNSLKSEIGTLKSQSEITNSKLDRLQQGYLNNQSSNENSGIQILSGPGGLLFATILTIVGVACVMHYRRKAIINEKTANILAERIITQEDKELVEQVFHAAMHTEVEENVLSLMKRHQARIHQIF